MKVKINLKVEMKVKVRECMWDSGTRLKADIGLSGGGGGQGWLWMQRGVMPKIVKVKRALPAKKVKVKRPLHAQKSES